MYSRLLASVGLAGMLFASPAFAAGTCCQEMKADCCPEMKAAKTSSSKPCCDHHPPTVAMPEADLGDPFFMALQADQPVPPAAVPARQASVVWFKQPVRVGNNILLGRYVIEHDNDRMAAGEPCTYIYRWEDQKRPVVAFHCVHLDRPGVDEPTVVLTTGADGFKRLAEFQFPGDSGGHGTPVVR